MITKEKHEQWLLIRKKTFIAFCIICFGLGFEYSLIFPSLWYYMSEVIKTNYAELFYGIALSAYPASSIVGAFTIARYADHSKRTRFVVLMLLLCEIIGNLLYSIHFSPFLPVAGRLIAGFGDVANMVMVGEVARCYETHEITSKISWMVMFFSVGFTLSPGMNIIFKFFDFYIGPVHMVYANMPGLFMSVCFILISILAYCMVYDISREYDLKATNEQSMFYGDEGKILSSQNSDHKSVNMYSDHESGTMYNDHESGTMYTVHESVNMYNDHESGTMYTDHESVNMYNDHDIDNKYKNLKSENEGADESVTMYNDHESTDLVDDYIKSKKARNTKKCVKSGKALNTLKCIFTTFDLVLLLVFGFVCSYTLFGFDTLMSLIASKYFNFDVSHTSIIFIIDGLLYGFVLLAIGKVSTKYSDFHIIIFAVVVQLFGSVAILCLNLYHTNIYFNYVCLVVYILAFSTTWSIEEVLSRSLFGKLVPSSCQSYAEGIRRSVSSIAFIISGISTAGLFDSLSIIFSILIVLTFILLIVFICRKESLTSPTPQFYTKDTEEEEALLAQ